MKGIKRVLFVALAAFTLVLSVIMVAACDSGPSRINISKQPPKKDYVVGQTLNVIGGELTVTWDGKEPVVVAMDAEGVVCSPKVLDTVGDGIPVTVTYMGKSTGFNVDVAAVKAVALEIADMPAKQAYTLSDTPDLTGGTVTVV